MPCFLIESTFTQPFESFGEIVAEHRAYLQQGYDAGWMLLSGPKADRSGGVLIARAENTEALAAFFAGDPYNRNHLASYRFTEFTAAKHAACLNDWLAAN